MTLADIIKASGAAVLAKGTRNNDPGKQRFVQTISDGIMRLIREQGGFYVHYEILVLQKEIRLPDGSPLPESYVRENPAIRQALRKRGAVRTFEQTLKSAYAWLLQDEVSVFPEVGRLSTLWRQSETGLRRFLESLKGKTSRNGRVTVVQLAQPYFDVVMSSTTYNDGRIRHGYTRRI